MIKLIGGLIFLVFSNVIALLAAREFISGFIFTGGFVDLVIAAGILTVINALLRPILKLLLGPLIVLTFGLFTIVVNAIMLLILDILINPLIIEGYIPLLWTTLIIGLINFAINLSAKFFYKR